MAFTSRLVATVLIALGPGLHPATVLASGEDGSPPGQLATTTENGRDLRSLLPAFMRNLLGLEDTMAAAGEDDGAGAMLTESRPSLLPLVEPLWIDLTDAQQQALAPFAPEWNTWSAAEKKAWVALANRLMKMSPDRRDKAERRILEWANLTPAQRQIARENYRLAKERPANERVTEWRNYQSLTKEQQSVLRQAGRTSNTAAGNTGAATGLAREASQPLPRGDAPAGRGYQIYPARGTPLRP